MMNRTVLTIGVALTAQASLGATTFLTSAGTTLYRTTINGGGGMTTTSFNIGADITSLAVNQATGEIYGSARTDMGGNGTFELYRLDDAMGTPSLTLIGDFLAQNTPSMSFINGTLYGFQQSPGGADNSQLVTIDIGAMTQATVDGDLGVRHESSGYDAMGDTLYANNRGNNAVAGLWTVPYSDADVASVFVGTTGQQAINNGGEFFNGTYYQAATITGGDTVVGSINTANGAFTSLFTLDNAEVLPTGLAVIPTPGVAGAFAVAGLAGLRRRR